MLTWLLRLQIQDVAFLVTIGLLALVASLYLLIRRPTRRWLITAGVALVGGGALGLALGWLVGDVMDVFDAALSTAQLLWIGVMFAAIALAVVNLWRSRWWRKAVAVLAIPLVLLTGGAFINASIGYYTDLSDTLGLPQYQRGSLEYEHGDTLIKRVAVVDMATWKAPADMPRAGKVVETRIPGTDSHFAVRDAVLYLPPAARVVDPPALPVVIALSGQPGSPSDWFTSGHIAQVMNSYAAKHHGIAPIVVSPDQLGVAASDTMCINSPLGNSATYITTDVVHWVIGHLHVATTRDAWSLMGFSQGGTCATQFLTADSRRFGSMIAVESQIGPLTNAADTRLAFHGDAAAQAAEQAAAMPIAIMEKHRPYKDTLAIFGVGQTDIRYVSWDQALHAAASLAGMDAKLYVSPGTGHDWFTVAHTVKLGLPQVARHMGIG